MKATILLGTLKKTGLSNTGTLCEFLSGRMERQGIRSGGGAEPAEYFNKPGKTAKLN